MLEHSGEFSFKHWWWHRLWPLSARIMSLVLWYSKATLSLLSKCNVDLVSGLPPISCVSRWSPCVYWLKHSQSAVSFPLYQAESSISICGILRCPTKSVAVPVFYSGAVVSSVLAAKCAHSPLINSLCTQPGKTSGNHLSPLPQYFGIYSLLLPAHQASSACQNYTSHNPCSPYHVCLHIG